MDEWKEGDGAAGGERKGDDETLLPTHEHELSRFGDYGMDEDEMSESEFDRSQKRKSVKGTAWMILATTATLTARGLVRGNFPYPLYLSLLLQISAYITVILALIIASLVNLRRPKRRNNDGYTILQRVIIGVRVLISAGFTAFAMVFAAAALQRYNNLSILAMLPILTFVFDGLTFRLLHFMRLAWREQHSWWPIWRIVVVPTCLAVAVYCDYRLDINGLLCALISSVLYSCSKAIMRIGPRIEKKNPTWDSPLYLYLLAGIPFILVSWRMSVTYENLVAANHALKSWTFFRWIWVMVPGVLLQLLFAQSINSAFPYSSKDMACGALEDPTPEGMTAVRATLHTGFWITILGAMGREYSLIDWIQIAMFMIVYIVSVGPRHIGYYPPRFFNIVTRLVRRKPTPIHQDPWQFPIVLVGTSIFFAVLMSCNVMYWIDTASFNRDAKSWLGPTEAVLDVKYRPPVARTMEIIIAHGAGESHESIRQLINDYTQVGHVAGFRPSVRIYTKDSTLTNSETVRGEVFDGDLDLTNLHNSGGPTASFLHHILYSWETLSQQTLFLSTEPSLIDPELSLERMREMFIPGGFPLPDAEEKSAFLNLGPSSVCDCGSCTDETGWEDSFHLVSSMWAAARPSAEKCGSVLLTRGNKFVASAARIRGTKRDVWQLLYDALVKSDVKNAWAHERRKLPTPLPHEPLIGRWSRGLRSVEPVGNAISTFDLSGEAAKQRSKTENTTVVELPGVYGLSDSLERPWLGFTIERLWGILLQCSKKEIAWRCPSLEKGWRVGWVKSDCECID